MSQLTQSIKKTQLDIDFLKDIFRTELGNVLNLTRVSAPLFLKANSGLNDNLNGVEREISFDTSCGETAVVIHSLAKWKRYALGRYGYLEGEGIYTDMNAIRRDEDIDMIHSYYVDQWDWELIINEKERNETKLEEVVNKIYCAMKQVELATLKRCPNLSTKLPENITYITSQELEDMYPNDTPQLREYKAVKQHKAIFLKKIGKVLKSGEVHDNRAPDYDDWELNGDIIVYHMPTDTALELSSMGIRVDSNTLMSQIDICNVKDRLLLPFHKDVLKGSLPFTIGGGIGQSRLCIFYLELYHIGQVQCSVWPESVYKDAEDKGIFLL
eukprot:GHVR01108843.1.p1 GENE.GHVR01108843.1~~GHVR01108843.1.p1  ORF type:complete len:327 (-),score=68.48 GHVR01108843.1:197-1177(-)